MMQSMSLGTLGNSQNSERLSDISALDKQMQNGDLPTETKELAGDFSHHLESAMADESSNGTIGKESTEEEQVDKQLLLAEFDEQVESEILADGAVSSAIEEDALKAEDAVLENEMQFENRELSLSELDLAKITESSAREKDSAAKNESELSPILAQIEAAQKIDTQRSDSADRKQENSGKIDFLAVHNPEQEKPADNFNEILNNTPLKTDASVQDSINGDLKNVIDNALNSRSEDDSKITTVNTELGNTDEDQSVHAEGITLGKGEAVTAEAIKLSKGEAVTAEAIKLGKGEAVTAEAIKLGKGEAVTAEDITLAKDEAVKREYFPIGKNSSIKDETANIGKEDFAKDELVKVEKDLLGKGGITESVKQSLAQQAISKENEFSSITHNEPLKNIAETGMLRPSEVNSSNLSKLVSHNMQTASQLQQPLDIQAKHASALLGERVLMMINQGKQEVQIRLDPAELGSMHIKLHVQQDQLQLSIQTDLGQSKDLIEQNLPKLREQLAQQGVSLGQTSVEQQNSKQQGKNDGSAASVQTASNNAQQIEDEKMEWIAPKIPLPAQGIDYYA